MHLVHSEEITEITGALAAAQAEMQDAREDGDNPYFDSTYATLASVRKATLPVLNKHGIAVLQPTVTYDEKLFVRTTLVHESGQWFAGLMPVELGKAKGPQAVGSGLTYARRYGLAALVTLATEDDDAETIQAAYRQDSASDNGHAGETSGDTSENEVDWEELLRNADTFQELKAVAQKLKNADVSDKRRAQLRTLYAKRVETLSNGANGTLSSGEDTGAPQYLAHLPQ